MPLPQVAIVGRPNVGKSSLFNWLAHKRLAIVDDRAGVTRDRVTFMMHEEDRYFELVDTGGMGIEDEDNLTAHIEAQIEAAIESADVVLFVVDTRSGITPLDHEVARRLRPVTKPIITVANKADAAALDVHLTEFAELAPQVLLPVSVHQNRHRDDLLRLVLERLPPADDTPPPGDPVMKLAIVGRRNTGKSTFVNTLAQSERMIVSEVPGTTRDSVDVRFELDGKSFVAIDTPGVKRAKSIAEDIEYYGLHRAQRSVRRADVVLIFFDCSQPISQVDKQLCDYVHEQFKPCIFVVNKWDLYAGSVSTDDWVQYLHDTFRTMHHVPIAFITGQTGKNMKALLNHAQMLFKQASGRVSTGELNRLLRWAVAKNEPPLYQNRRPKIFYATQVGTEPPTIVLFTSEPAAIGDDYQRYLLTQFRDHLSFSEVPIKLYLRAAHDEERRESKRPEAEEVRRGRRKKSEAESTDAPAATFDDDWDDAGTPDDDFEADPADDTVGWDEDEGEN
jgi:GTP-binding protein